MNVAQDRDIKEAFAEMTDLSLSKSIATSPITHMLVLMSLYTRLCIRNMKVSY